MKVHPNAMIHWDDIACRRDHTHRTRGVMVALGGPTDFRDCAPVPYALARHFEMFVWDPDEHPVDGGPYCPAHDAVSATIVSHGIWEPRETTIALHALSTAVPEAVCVDIGAQLGWYSLLAASCGLDVIAIDAEEANLRLLTASAEANGWGDHVTTLRTRIGRETPALELRRVALAKIDVEGAEDEAVRILWPSIEAGLVDHILMEVSPCFAGYYPDLLATLAERYRIFTLPPKQRPPISLIDLCALEPYRIDDRPDLKSVVAGWHQEDVFMVREDLAW